MTDLTPMNATSPFALTHKQDGLVFLESKTTFPRPLAVDRRHSRHKQTSLAYLGKTISYKMPSLLSE